PTDLLTATGKYVGLRLDNSRRSRWMRAKAAGSVILLVGASPRPTVNKLNRLGDASELAPLSPQSLVAHFYF
ncbi:MAG TPA: hypothetical protein VF444_19600, partial [Pseudonocardiaceae bacterium]